MRKGAPRPSWCVRLCHARGAWLMVCLGLALPVSGQMGRADPATVCVEGDGPHIRSVCLVDVPGAPAYGHAVLGATPEWDLLRVTWGSDGRVSEFRQDAHVFEDIAPRVVDLDGDGRPEIIVVQSSFSQGARLVVLRTTDGLSATATPYIGQRNRWLAPIGAADLDGDGNAEIAYIDRPHLAKQLRIWRFADGALNPVADLDGLTNHRIGWDFIAGGVRTCGTRPELTLASADWTRVVAASLTNGQIATRDLGPYRGPPSLTEAQTCP